MALKFQPAGYKARAFLFTELRAFPNLINIKGDIFQGLEMTIGQSNTNLTYDGKFKEQKTEFHLMEYGHESYSYKKVEVEEIPTEGSEKIRWIQVRGMSDIGAIKTLAKKFNIHSLNLKNILNINTRSEVLSTGERMMIVFNFPRGGMDFQIERVGVIRIRQINTIITFEENPKSIFEKFPNIIEEDMEDIKAAPVDHLLFLLMERVLDKYFSTITILSERLREYGKELNEEGVDPDLFASLHYLKGKTMNLIDCVEPVKNSVEKGLRFRIEEREEYSLIHARIISQHLSNILDQLESLDERVSHSFDLALSLNDYKMNEIMKKLTIIATIFLPLTFIAGIYGMNFKLIPELEVKYGYFYSLGFMVLIAVGILTYFKKKKWI